MEITRVDAASILTPTGGFLRPSAPGALDGYTHTLNPAIGCPYGRGFCGQYCYARTGMAHRFHGGGRSWGDYVRVKANAAKLLRRELESAAARPLDHPHYVGRLRIFASSTTDPCAGPALEIFRDCLRVLVEFPIAAVVIQTRSPQVLSLFDEVHALSGRCVLSFTIETDSDEIWRHGPAGAPSIAVRRKAFEALHTWGACKHLAVGPCLPLVDPLAFADWIAATAETATVDTFSSGDGSGGARTSALPLPQLYSAQGWNWRDESQARLLFALLQKKMGDRAACSQDGFRRLPLRLTPGAARPRAAQST